ncbi:hypothetical protein GE21DRAFT_2419 [Neurospora crassa]|uniref:Uncharacterized protein n=1 Tax=Neurospora crassa (strain ATCC 24698 / 74-OR23-1A / CBS 708.71 / DSM 1257 / FGSC 987) TaxID=367110 RepID=Q7SHM8_NEUCR|nr:hypothetical protein NCU02876 [Neurospora crassa OR74A]EAA36322.2 hypothetical protein NCU02876 [Neurospora crassa OR74A]KHE89357.1 hypothetical protein GE21DRAFT_2419 [Neurospora crassa]|eukprot:XP_965558.2 hypothetical protein NCU02876 [Neurospora crassa OR74A]
MRRCATRQIDRSGGLGRKGEKMMLERGVRELHPGQAQWCVCDVEWVPRRLTDRRFCNASSPVSTSL